MIDDRLVQSQKALARTDDTESGITADIRLVHPLKAPLPIETSVSGITTHPFTLGVIMHDPRMGTIIKFVQQKTRTAAAATAAAPQLNRGLCTNLPNVDWHTADFSNQVATQSRNLYTVSMAESTQVRVLVLSETKTACDRCAQC